MEKNLSAVDAVDAEVGAEEAHHHHLHAIGIENIAGLVHRFRRVDPVIFLVEDPQVTLAEDTPVLIVIMVEAVVMHPAEEDLFVAAGHVPAPTLHALLQFLGLALQGADPQVIQFAPVVQEPGLSPVRGLHPPARCPPSLAHVHLSQGAALPALPVRCPMIPTPNTVAAGPVALAATR